MSYIQKHSVHMLTLRQLLYNSETWQGTIQNKHVLADAAYKKLQYYVASFSYNTHLYVIKSFFHFITLYIEKIKESTTM